MNKGCSTFALFSFLLAAPLLHADFSGHFATHLQQGLNSEDDAQWRFELGGKYQWIQGYYLAAQIETQDWLDSDQKLRDHSEVELSVGYQGESQEGFSYDIGLRNETSISFDRDAQWFYWSLGWRLDADVSAELTLEKLLDLDDKYSNLELRLSQPLESIEVFAGFTLGLEDDEQKTLELGVGQAFIPGHYLHLSYFNDLEISGDRGYMELGYRFEF